MLAGSTATGNALVTSLVLRVSMCSGDCLPSGDPSARLPAYTIKKLRNMFGLTFLHLASATMVMRLPGMPTSMKSTQHTEAKRSSGSG
uniref:SFRICE_012647 n=1 Tax=Spodoptera frugiperda TaxID=7108 RepID=A0A2H1X0Y9_SPOFR